MSRLSRRSLVAGAATLPAAALTAGSAAIAAIGDTSRAAGIARARHIVELLSDRFIRDGWHESFDRERAARFIENMHTFDEDDGADPRFQEVLEWVHDHGQSLDWLFDGGLVGMICRPASHSPVATAIPDPAFAVIERYRAASKVLDAASDEEDPGYYYGSPLHAEWAARNKVAYDAFCDAEQKMVHTIPTTRAGAVGMINAYLGPDGEGAGEVDLEFLASLAEASHLA
jgi:hypothetical protein